ncbi:PHB depolymerase family esterase [Citricoccus sp. SGAir0253]|uniref:extracellular catalytic domain type 1 short-chain-length polyhydroxyalkanoate depolymerase n=1 Tax=Citricoccus sp. SGAir0253 TaxID=2567881 RepID=UPI0010CD2D81|nr:PHB depolymerase family esterase [Citricoccus sp. SGAir0253]QCU78849.1 PHB depolymerase family esterase [Citricoccus sp. SGAir0253]
MTPCPAESRPHDREPLRAAHRDRTGPPRPPRPGRRAPAAALAAVVLTGLVSVLALVGFPPAAQAILCPPALGTLPGCTGPTDAGTGGTEADASAPSGTWTTETIAGMAVHLYVPTTAPAHPDGRALMVSLHGCVQKAGDLRTGGNWTATADEYGMVVALPAAPNGGVLLGCWDYYGTGHDRTAPARHDDNLLGLVGALTARDALDLDTDQVYLSGLSSGGGQTMVMGCLAPDVFAGIGINAGPTVGTGSGQISTVSTTQAQGTATCRDFAGDAASAFGTQLTSVVYGNDDTVVAPGYNPLNARIMAGIYGAATVSSFPLAGLDGSSTAGEGTLYSDDRGPRVSLVQNTGLGHNWPAGEGPGGPYISTRSIDYPAYVTAFFVENNRRTGPVPPPGPTPTAEPTLTAEPTPTLTPTAEPSPTTEPTPAPTGSTAPTGDPDGCVTAANADHEAAGRAVSYGTDPYNPFYAVGTQDYLGQGDATVTSLRRTAEGVYDHVPAC